MPETMSAGYPAAEREAYRSVRRACDAGLDSTTLRVELTRHVMGLIPAEASYFGAVRRHTALLDDLVGEDASAEIARDLLEASYSPRDAQRAIALARSGEVVDTDATAGMSDWMHGAGFGRQLRAAFAGGQELGGIFLALRERHSRAFGEHDTQFLRRIAPHIARALRRAALVDAARVTRVAPLAPNDTTSTDLAPGVVVIDDRWRITHSTRAAGTQLADLADATDATSAATTAIVDFLRRHRAARGATGVSFLSLRGRSGRWYTLRAARTEPDELGRSSTVLIIAQANTRGSGSRA
jgi:hypothetical protein